MTNSVDPDQIAPVGAMPHFQLLPMSKVDQSQLRTHEVPPLQ